MSSRVMCALLLAAAASCAGAGETQAPPDLSEPPVTVAPVGVVRGSWLFSRRGRPVRAFRGLRYAHPPVAARRFQPPEPILQYEGSADGSADGPACPQPVFDDYFVHEDCLRLNVYAPARHSAPLPVIVFMHAGGFYSVSGRSDVAGPSYLLDRDLVLVTINYRLASLGFLSTGDEHAPGNNGFKDQVAALRWVRRNIAAFGGNPDLVTIAGYSAGSFSVALHMVSPMSKGLFHRAISMSGSPISQILLPHDQKQLAIRQADLLGCPSHSSEAMLDCLRTKPSVELGNSLDSFFEYAHDPVLVWVPVIERDFGQERFLAEPPLAALRAGRAHTVPYIVSQTADEFFWKAFTILGNASLTQAMDSSWSRMAAVSFQLPPAPPPARAAAALRAAYLGPDAPLANDSVTAAALGKLYSDGIIGFGVHTLANVMAVHSPQPVYCYEFAYVGQHSHYVDPDTGKPTGAAHHDDLLYLFSINASFPVTPAADRDPDSRLVDFMTRMWLDFATTGDPNPRSPGPAAPAWPRFTRARRRYLRVGAARSVHERLFESRYHVWEKIYNPPHCDYCTY